MSCTLPSGSKNLEDMKGVEPEPAPLLVDKHMGKLRQTFQELIEEFPQPEMSHLTLSKSSKVSKRAKACFNLPPGLSCPGRTETCSATCYASKKRGAWTVVQKPQLRNYRIMKWVQEVVPERRQEMLDYLKDTIPASMDYFRIHSAGDFYNQWYVDVWKDLIASRPDVKFWAYTRSFHLDFNGLVALDNMQLFASTDNDNLIAALHFVDKTPGVRYAHGPWDPKGESDPAELEMYGEVVSESTGNTQSVKPVVCPATNGVLTVSVGACMVCKFCMEPRNNKNIQDVVFQEH